MQSVRTALITGATGGLGIHLCREFARNGFDLIVTARDPVRLKQLAARLHERYDVRITEIALDLNQKNAARLLYDKVYKAGIPVDVLVNNAGFGLGGVFVRNRPRLQDAMIRVNLVAPTHLCRLFLPGMLRRGRGAILNVASLGSFVPGPFNSIYCASKAYLLSLTEALAEELRGTPIHVTAVCPGSMHTGFAHRANMETTRLFHYGVYAPERVARCAYRALVRRKVVAMPGLFNRTLILSTRLAPRFVIARVSGAAQRPYTVMSPHPHGTKKPPVDGHSACQ